ncbi:Holliday junction resolvase RuvX [Mucisphaera calidilacus]|uniref:Putative pre-16S rRNA nuclease n=1 Tax=Mucisphaera calidilacus TaxID=2527982 RepID=A0A518C0C3_9BACT|nr:Holliday junction resolvase RuvX [Mucisphaera calidilacus]QDU72675.1 Putative Holliday junction resolvase [Mucisphaera calidilacus]
MKRYLAIDPGGKRTGLALGDDLTKLASPLDVIQTASPTERLRQIRDAIEREQPDELVLGLPLNMDGSEGPAAKAARLFADELREATQLEVHLADERLTSDVADQQMARTGLTHKQKKQLRDALAAATLLQDFLNQSA